MEITSLTNTDLEQLLEDFPWFALARKEYVSRMTEDGDEALREAVKEAGIHLLSRSTFIKSIKTRRESSRIKEVIEAPDTVKPDPETPVRTQYHIVGGDYFGQEDFQQLEREGVHLEKNNIFSPISSALNAVTREAGFVAPIVEGENVTELEDEIITETLAKVYAKQEHYQRALEIYDKLILLYPEKSAYFAPPMKELKNKIK